MIEVRAGTHADAAIAAALHSSEISEGFLPSLGPRFLARLYRRVVRSSGSFLLVALDDGKAVGFVAGTEDVRELYRTFLLRDGVIATLAALPRVTSSWRRVVETLHYGASAGKRGKRGEHEGVQALPPAELLAIAVAPEARGRGAGSLLVEALTAEFARRGIRAIRVVVGAGNESAIRLYERCGFTTAAGMEVHKGTPSQVLTWS
jgi:ribosomal protein S18 acetylase RimI-like enzyme